MLPCVVSILGIMASSLAVTRPTNFDEEEREPGGRGREMRLLCGSINRVEKKKKEKKGEGRGGGGKKNRKSGLAKGKHVARIYWSVGPF